MSGLEWVVSGWFGLFERLSRLLVADLGVHGMLGGLYMALKVRYAEYGGWNSAACAWGFPGLDAIYKPPSKIQSRDLPYISRVASRSGRFRSGSPTGAVSPVQNRTKMA